MSSRTMFGMHQVAEVQDDARLNEAYASFATNDLAKPDRPSLDDRLLPPLIESEPAATRVLWLAMIGIIALLYAYALFTFWAPADGGIDQNAYLVGGKQLANSFTTRFTPQNPFEYVGHMFVVPLNQSSTDAPAISFYPKYPFGLPLLYAIVIWLVRWQHAVTLTFAVSPLCAVTAVIGMFFLARAVAGSFVATLAAIVLATSQTMWLLANVANSHAPCIAFVVWGMFMLVRWWRTGSIWRGVLAGFLLGYACSIRYSEGLLIVPILLAAALRVRWRDWRSYFRNAAPIVGWVVPVGALLLFNHFTIGTMTGYDMSNESEFGRAFTWDKFADTWEQMLRTFHDQGLFFTVPLGVAGLVMLFARSWRLALVILGWLLPGVALYTAYYWSPDRGVAYGRFFLSFFPALLVGFAVCVRYGILRERHAALTLAAAAIVAIAAGVGTWRAIESDEGGGGGFNQSMPGQFRARASLANLGSILRERIPAGSVVFAEEGRGLNGPTNYLSFAGDWQLFSTGAFDNSILRRLRNGPGFGDPNNPTPMQPKRREVMGALYEGKTDKQLTELARQIGADALAAGRRMFVIAAPGAADSFKRKYFPSPQFNVRTVQWWKDVPEPRDDQSSSTTQRRRPFAGPGGGPQRPQLPFDQRINEWKLIEITAAPPTTRPTTSR